MAEEVIVVMRYPCIPEDEGRHEFISTFPSREKAEAWVAAQKKEYFRPSDYYILAKD